MACCYKWMFVTLLKLSVVIAISSALIHYWMQNKSFTFSAEIVKNIALKHYEKDINITKAYDNVHKEFLKQFPGHILPESSPWLFMNAGGWMGGMKILHASLSEYLILFGTGVNTSGNSGRYYANISDTILTGTFRQWKEGNIHTEVFYPGDTVYHYWGEASAVEWTAGTWMVEYGRGFIPSTLGFALADTIFSTLDFVTLYYILLVYGQALIMEVQTFVAESLGS